MRVAANGLAIEVDDQGPTSGAPVLMIMGLGMQLTAWPPALVRQLVAQGHRVIRFDNRDAGLSEGFDHLGVPNVGWAALRYWLHLDVQAPYGIADMADDAIGVLDALGLASAHVCGASMGGMVAQHLAARHPDRVRSLTLMMTSSGARHLPQASMRLRHALFERPDGPGVDARVDCLERVFTLIGSPAYRPERDALRDQLAAAVQRAWRPAGVARQLVAVAADGDRSSMLGAIRAPTHIVHGGDDPLVPVAAAHDLRAKIGGATVDVVDGMGHDMPQPLVPRFAAAIAQTAQRAG